MCNIEDPKSKQHRQRVQTVLERLVVRDGAVESLSVLADSEDDSDLGCVSLMCILNLLPHGVMIRDVP